jgi:hypothetical protein
MGLPSATDQQGRGLQGTDLEITSGLSAANTSQTLIVGAAATPIPGPSYKRRLRKVTIHYSAGIAAQVTVTITQISALGAAYNVVLLSQIVAAGGQDVVYYPSGEDPYPIGDSIQVVAPAGGAAVTSGVVVFDEITGVSNRATDPSDPYV